MFNILQSLVSSSCDLIAASDKTNKTFYLAPPSQVKPPSSWETCVLLQKTCLIGLIHIVFSLINTRFLWRSTQILGSLNPFRVSPLCSSLNHPPSFSHILFPTLRLSSSPSSSHSIASTPFISLWPPLPPIFLIVIPNYHTLSAWHTIMCHITSCIWIKHTDFKHYHPPISPPKANLFSLCVMEDFTLIFSERSYAYNYTDICPCGAILSSQLRALFAQGVKMPGETTWNSYEMRQGQS